MSNAYNRPDQLSTALRERIIATAKQLGYAGPDPVARSLATQRTGSVAVMLCDGLSSAFSDPALSIMLDALSSTVDSGERSLLLLPGIGDAGPHAQSVMRAQTDVVVAYSLPDDAPALDAVRERELPLVVVDQPEVPGSARVRVDDFGGAVPGRPARGGARAPARRHPRLRAGRGRRTAVRPVHKGSRRHTSG